MIFDNPPAEKPPFRLALADATWVWILLLGNVMPLLWWARIDGWARVSLSLYAGR
jgi:hypothetical protein